MVIVCGPSSTVVPRGRALVATTAPKKTLVVATMISCPRCTTLHSSTLSSCPQCGFAPVVKDGFPSWLLSSESASGFKREYFAPLAAHEESNFWFVARNRLILWALNTYCRPFKSFLEIGCGTGFVLAAVARHFPDVGVTGSEVFSEGLAFAATRAPGARFVQMDACVCPYVEEFDVVAAFDVVEHIDDDEAVLANLFRALKPGGHALISVPQHRWLWSASDDYACHRRRYTSKELHTKLRQAKFVIERSTSFVSLLLLALLLSRLRPASQPYDPLAEFEIHPALNRLLKAVLECERRLIGLGMNFPIGGSRFVIAKKSAI